MRSQEPFYLQRIDIEIKAAKVPLGFGTIHSHPFREIPKVSVEQAQIMQSNF